MFEPSEWIDARITLIHCCHCLGIDPPLEPGDSVSWIGQDPDAGVGINALIARHDPIREDEPSVLSISAYEEVLVRGPAGQDYGTDRMRIAVLDFAPDTPEKHDLSSLNEPLTTRLKLINAEFAPALATPERSLEAILIELGRILARWPATREHWDD
ncbi:MAG TPA: hypothetical protein P5330_12460 [Candidatus Competibacteraceae bacterium]|nr:hypothetical protein [Candidatus Competibacteraceae bacterium]